MSASSDKAKAALKNLPGLFLIAAVAILFFVVTSFSAVNDFVTGTVLHAVADGDRTWAVVTASLVAALATYFIGRGQDWRLGATVVVAVLVAVGLAKWPHAGISESVVSAIRWTAGRVTSFIGGYRGIHLGDQ